MRRREAYVDHGSLRVRVEQRLREVSGVVDRVQDREAVALEQLDQAGPEEGVVFGEDKTHGTSRVTTVGPPAGLDTFIVPSNAASRRITPSMPVPDSRIGATTAVVAHHGAQDAVPVRQRDPGVRGPGVPDHVGQALGHREVERRLDRVRWNALAGLLQQVLTPINNLLGTRINAFCAGPGPDAKRVTVAVVLDRTPNKAAPTRPIYMTTLVTDPARGLLN